MDRRTLLSIPGLGVVGALLVGCGQDEVVTADPPDGAVRYGDDPSQFAELTLPEGTPVGVVVVIHGGFWRAAYDYTLGRPLVPSLTDRGWAVWNLEYRRVGDGGGVPETLDDVAAGIDALVGTGLDLSTVVAVGHSAGGHLAAWAAARGSFARWQPERVPLTAVISQAGVLDLATAYDENLGDGAVRDFLGRPPGAEDDTVDPTRQLPLQVPAWCVHAEGDTTVPFSQSTAYVEAARAAGGRAELVSVPGDHMSVIDPTSSAWASTLAVLDGLADRG